MENMETSETVHGTLVDNVESTFFSWITVASIFLAAALVIPVTKRYFAPAFLIISIVLLLIGAFDYLGEGQILISTGLPIPSRLRLLFWLTLVILAIEVLLLFDFLIQKTCPPDILNSPNL